MENVLSVQKLSYSYGAAEVISDISFDVNRGDFIALVGPNGAGKSTLIRVILGLASGFSGRVKLLGSDLSRFSDWGKIGYLPQRVNVFNPLFPATVREVVGLGLLAGKPYPKRFHKDDQEQVNDILSFLGIADLQDWPIVELSGGQQQRVFLARALVSRPELLIMDEPSTALDPETRDNFFKLIRSLNQERKATIIMITHDAGQVGEYADQLLYLDKRVIFYGPFSDFCRSAEMEKYFGHLSHHSICHQH